MCCFYHTSNTINLVTASVDASLRIVEHTILMPDVVDGRAPTHGVIFAKYVAQITKQQGRYAVGHDLSPFGLRNEYDFPGGFACFKELVNLGRLGQRIFRDFDLQLACAYQLEECRQCLRHLVKAAFEIETTESDVLLDHRRYGLKRKCITRT